MPTFTGNNEKVRMRITLKLPSGKPVSHDFEMTTVVIGRSNRCDFPVADDSLSRTHAQIDYIDGDFYVTDLGSSNGVFIDGNKIPPNEKQKFNSFQQLSIATLECVVEDTSDAPVIPLAQSKKKPDLKTGESSEHATGIRHIKQPAKEASTSPRRQSQPSKTKPASDKKSQTKTLIAPVLILLLAGGAFIYFKGFEETDQNLNPDEKLVASNVPESMRDVKDDFGDYLLVYANNGCTQDSSLCQELKLSGQQGEGVVRNPKEVYLFLTPPGHYEDPAFNKIKEHPEVNDIIGLYLLLNSSLMQEFSKKSIAQVHLVILDKDLKQTKAFRFHQKYFTGNEITRMLTELGAVVDEGAKIEAFWNYSRPLIQSKNF